jgi:hypothetical protein
MVPNPLLNLQLLQDGGVIAAIDIEAPVPGDGLRRTRVTRTDEPAVFTWLFGHVIADRRGLTPPAIPAELAPRLTELGVLVPADRLPHPVRFAPDLDDPGADLMPSRRMPPELFETGDQDTLVNPTFRHLGTSDVRGRLAHPLAVGRAFAPERAWAVVDETGVPGVALCSAGGEEGALLEALHAGQPPPPETPAATRRRLARAGILKPAAALARERAERDAAIAAARQHLAAHGYARLRDVLHPVTLSALRRYYRALIAEGHLPFGDAEWPHRYFAYNAPVLRLLHHELAGLAGQLAGEPVKASFSYLAVYHPGSVLPAHRDREQCEYSISLLLDHTPEPADVSPWPLYLERPGSGTGPIPAVLGVGDLLIYLGREMRHHREALAPGLTAGYGFLFYVPEGFTGSLA